MSEQKVDPQFRAIGPYEFSGFVILNHLGTIWGPTVYDSPEEAHAYIDRWQKDNPNVDLSKHRVVPGYSKTYGFEGL